jgi:serine/threonine protein kinase
MKAMLTMDHNERITAVEALADPYFDGLRDSDVDKLIKEQLGANVNTHGSQA